MYLPVLGITAPRQKEYYVTQSDGVLPERILLLLLLAGTAPVKIDKYFTADPIHSSQQNWIEEVELIQVKLDILITTNHFVVFALGVT